MSDPTPARITRDPHRPTIGDRTAPAHVGSPNGQVLVGFDDLSCTDAVVEAVQRDDTCWLGATTWRGKRLIRISVTNWTTTESDIHLSADAIRARRLRFGPKEPTQP